MRNKGQKWDWKEWLKDQKGKKEQWLILTLTGILLLVIALPTASSKKSTEETKTAETYKTEESTDSESYTRQLEKRLEESLAQVKGVGNVTVMITLSSTGEKVVEKDKESSTEHTTDGEGTSSQNNSSSETSVYSGDSGSEKPYVKKELSPDIKGVIVVADGGDNAVVIENITEAVQALFGVDTHKIKVMKRN